MATKSHSVFTATQHGKALKLNVTDYYNNGTSDFVAHVSREEVVDFNKSKIDFIYTIHENFLNRDINEPHLHIGGFIIHEDGVKKFDFRFNTDVVINDLISKDEAHFNFKMSSLKLKYYDLQTATDVMSAFLDNQYNS